VPAIKGVSTRIDLAHGYGLDRRTARDQGRICVDMAMISVSPAIKGAFTVVSTWLGP
jgi:hypothetical protein